MASAFSGDPSTSASIAVVHALGADTESGLSAMEAARRYAEVGPNELLEGPRVPEWRRVLAHFQNPLVYLLLAAVTVAFVAWLVEGQNGYPVDALVIASVVLINGVLGYLQEARADKAVAALARMTAVTCSVVRGGTMVRVPASELVPGDLLVLAEGDAVGADARLIDATSLRTQEASLTGESDAALKDASILLESVAIGSRLNMVFKGTAVAQGAGRAVVTATGMDTEMGSIATMLEETIEAPTPLQVEVEKIGMRLGIAVVLVAIVVVTTILLTFEIKGSGGVIQVLLLGVSLAVAAVPEGLAAILTVVLALGVQRLARHQAIVKKLSSVETLGSASVIASDKTGTLTRAEMTIVRVVTASGSTDITGVGYAPDGRVESSAAGASGTPLDGALRAEQIVVLCGGSLANNAQLQQKDNGAWEIQGDPTEAAFLVAERKLGVHERREKRFERIGELPFTSERKMMSVVARDHERGDEAVLVTKGAPDVLLQHCTRLRVGKDVRVLDSDTRSKLLTDVDALSGAALRTLAVAYRPLDATEAASAPTFSGAVLERDLIFVGTAGIIDPPRDEAAVAVAEAQRAGIRIIMMTGDHPRTAARIASDLGIVPVGETALTGLELDALDDAGFAEVVRTRSVFARVAPANKLRIVNVLREFGNVVAVTGDGVNDAPALKAADIGIAMGRTGTEVSKEAAKMILADDNFATIVEAVREGRGIFDNIRKFLRYLLCSNMGEVLAVFLGVVAAGVIGLTSTEEAVVLPLLATQLLWINLVTDTGPALAMGLDPPTPDLMSRKPRRLGEGVIDTRMWSDVIQMGLVTALVTLLTMDMYLPAGLIDGHYDVVTARTAGFTTLVFACLFTCFHARSETASAFSQLFQNLWLWGAIALSALLQVAVVNLEFLNLAFGTVPLALDQWLVCIAMASMVLWFSELRKLIARAWKRVRNRGRGL